MRKRKSKFQKARETMADCLRRNKDLREGYRSNVAMLLHDRYGITDHTLRNQAAEDILKLVFNLDKCEMSS